MQRADNLLNVRIGGYNKMKAARDEVNARMTTTLKAKLLNLIAHRKIARETQATLRGIKAAIEAAQHKP